MYDLVKDPYQLKNIASDADPNLLVELNKRLLQLSVCSGTSCHSLDDRRLYVPHITCHISASGVTTLWRYTNLFVIILIVITAQQLP